MIYEVVYCSDCKKPIKSVPSWLAGVHVRFTCESCRQKHPRGIMGLDTPPPPRLAGGSDLDPDDPLAEHAEIDGDHDVSLDDADPDAVDEPLAGAIVEE